MANSTTYQGTVILCGIGVTGKTCLFDAFVDGKFNDETWPTITFNISRKTIQTDSGKVILTIIDSLGQEGYIPILSNIFKKADSIVIVTCVNIDYWHSDVSKMIDFIKEVNKDARLYLALTKSDVEITIDLNEVADFAKQNNCCLFLVSAKDQDSVNSMMLKIAIDIIDDDKVLLMNEKEEENFDSNECVCNVC